MRAAGQNTLAGTPDLQGTLGGSWDLPEVRLMAKFSGQLGRLGLEIFLSILNLYGCFGDPQWSHWLGSTFAIQNP